MNCLFKVCLMTVLVAVVAAAPRAVLTGEDSFDACKNNEDCGPGECCVLGMQRYSMPSCRQLGKANHHCRVDNPGYNHTLAYPNGRVLKTGPIFTLFCPCEFGLSCERAQCVSQTATDTNDLSNQRRLNDRK